MYCHEGEPLYDPERDKAFIDAFKKYLAPHIQVKELDAHINDRFFAETAVDEMMRLMSVH
jgi:uncharacterized protein (UPF0261 family)